MKLYEINFKGKMVLYARDQEHAEEKFWEEAPTGDVEIVEILRDEATEDCRRCHEQD